jgi:hypothetical protein
MIGKKKVFVPDKTEYVKQLRENLKDVNFVGDSGVVKKAKIEELLVKLEK